MLNYIWVGMIVIGVAVAVFTGKTSLLTTAVIDSARDGVTICVTMLGILSLWTGIMRIAEESGVIGSLTRLMSPLMRFLFPRLPQDGEAVKYISTNVIANFLGLGWAATPAGLRAMDALQRLNHGRETASREMCMFLIFNMSSLQLVSVNLLSYRAQYDSANPAEIVAPGLLATLISTAAAIAAAKLLELFDRRGEEAR